MNSAVIRSHQNGGFRVTPIILPIPDKPNHASYGAGVGQPQACQSVSQKPRFTERRAQGRSWGARRYGRSLSAAAMQPMRPAVVHVAATVASPKQEPGGELVARTCGIDRGDGLHRDFHAPLRHG